MLTYYTTASVHTKTYIRKVCSHKSTHLHAHKHIERPFHIGDLLQTRTYSHTHSTPISEPLLTFEDLYTHFSLADDIFEIGWNAVAKRDHGTDSLCVYTFCATGQSSQQYYATIWVRGALWSASSIHTATSHTYHKHILHYIYSCYTIAYLQ